MKRLPTFAIILATLLCSATVAENLNDSLLTRLNAVDISLLEDQIQLDSMTASIVLEDIDLWRSVRNHISAIGRARVSLKESIGLLDDIAPETVEDNRDDMIYTVVAAESLGLASGALADGFASLIKATLALEEVDTEMESSSQRLSVLAND